MTFVLDELTREGIARILREMVVNVTFTKTDGSERIMKCTLNETLVPQTEKKESGKSKTPNPEVCPVWDLELEAWRSFRWDSITKLEL